MAREYTMRDIKRDCASPRMEYELRLIMARRPFNGASLGNQLVNGNKALSKNGKDIVYNLDEILMMLN